MKSAFSSKKYIHGLNVFGQDGLVLAKLLFACFWTETDLRSIKTQKEKERARPISSHLWSKKVCYAKIPTIISLAGHARM